MRFILALLILAFAAISYAAPNNMPKRKPGLWEIKMQSPEMEMAMISQHCIDEKTDNLLQQQGRAQSSQKCSNSSVRKEGDKIIVESECQYEGRTARTKAVFSGDFSQHYRGEIHTTYTPPLHNIKSSTQTFKGKWLGACKPGQKPGDVVIPGMGSMNLNEMMKNIPNGHQPRTPR